MTKHALPVCALMASIASAAAQAPPSPTTPLPPIAPAASTSDCTPIKPVPPRATAPPEGATTGQGSGPLSDQLAKSNGVLCPPSGVDPEIRAPTPDAGNTPVIPPPGSPGGNPNMRPK